MKNTSGRPLFSLREAYLILLQGIRTNPFMQRAIKKNLFTIQTKERIMLAVTEVNQCPLCSYAHTRMALESGMSNVEIEAMLAGIADNIPRDEMAAIMFAQHYAEMRGKPSKESWQRLVQEYGVEKANGILGVVRTIMVGNCYGIALGSLAGRLKGKADNRSNLLYELVFLLTLIPLALLALLHTILATIFQRPIISFL